MKTSTPTNSFPSFSRLLQKNSPPYWDYRFWILQFLNLIVFIIVRKTPHSASSLSLLNKELQDSFAVQVFLLGFLVTSSMAALLFGPRGTIQTIGVIAIFSLPSIRNWGSTPYGNLILARLGVVSVLAIATAILVSRERNARLKVQDLNEKMKEIVKEKDKFFTLASEAQENERRRISRDLHDDSLQLLASVMHKLDGAINAQNLDDARAQMLRAKETITQTSDAIRRYCEELRPMLLDSLGFAPSVEWMGRELELSSGIKVDFETRGENREIRAKDIIHIYRVMQESFHNIERHSKATAARVVWNFTQEDLEISVTDNGIGMWNFGPAPARSLGIQGMHERMELIGGKLTIESQPGFGTKISLRVPFEEPIT